MKLTNPFRKKMKLTNQNLVVHHVLPIKKCDHFYQEKGSGDYGAKAKERSVILSKST
jgi:hypothetical protein